LAERRKLRRPADLGQHTLLHTETRADAWPDWLARSRLAAVDASKGQRFEHFYFLLEAAVGGLGVAVAPKPLVMEDLKLGRLVAPFGFVRSGRQYCLLYRGLGQSPHLPLLDRHGPPPLASSHALADCRHLAGPCS
jgi:DNA-binding transcriptional LysR family regulator